MEKGTEKMSNVKITACPEWILQEEPEQAVKLSAGVYLRRLDALIERMDETDTDFVVIYGDREHFANIEYFTRYDCRFEEGLFIVSRNGNRTIVVGNEGEAYSKFIPYPVERIVYRHFSLQGQPRNGIQKLRDVYRQAGLKPDSRVGFVSVKYFEGDAADDPAHQFDAPEYMLTELYKVVDRANVVNYTREITGLPNGVRMRLREAEEIAEWVRLRLHDAPLTLAGHALVSLAHLRTRTRRQPKTGLFSAELRFRAVTEETEAISP